MKTNHTTPPWKIISINNNSEYIITGDLNFTVAIVDMGTNEKMLANAKLISAAPELLESLQKLLSWANISDSSSFITLREECKKAIKKATE